MIRRSVAVAATPAEDTFVLAGRPLRDGYVLGETSRYHDDVWLLGPALLQRQQKSLQIRFMPIPERYREAAKNLLFCMISGDIPAGEARLDLVSIRSASTQVRRFFHWLDAHFAESGVPALALSGLLPSHLDSYRKYLTETLDELRASKALSVVRYFWRYRTVLQDHLLFDPLVAVDNWSVPHYRRPTENATPRLPDEVLGPLVTWCLRLIDDFSPDIMAAVECWRRMRDPDRPKHDSTRDSPELHELLDRHLQEQRPLPGFKGAPNINFIASLVGVERNWLVRRRSIVDAVAAVVGISDKSYYEIDISGRIGKSFWIDGIVSDHTSHNGVAHLALMLQTACYVIIAYFSGMRDSEIKHLRRACLLMEADADGRPYRWRVRSIAFKGEDVHGVEASWVVHPAVGRAVEVLERLQPPSSEFLFAALSMTPGGHKLRPGGTLSTAATREQLNKLQDWINEHCERYGTSDRIPLVNGRKWRFTTAQFRRTLAWFIAREPGGSIAGAIQYRHMSVQMFEGYAGTSDSGFRAEVEAEEALARGEILLASVEGHEHPRYTGPASEELITRLQHFQHQAYGGAVVTDRARLARLMRTHDPAVYPGRYSTCVFNPDKALCAKSRTISGTLRPLLASCRPLDCANVALSSSNLEELQQERVRLAEQLESRPILAPLLRDRVQLLVQALDEFIAEHGRATDGPEVP